MTCPRPLLVTATHCCLPISQVFPLNAAVEGPHSSSTTTYPSIWKEGSQLLLWARYLEKLYHPGSSSHLSHGFGSSWRVSHRKDTRTSRVHQRPVRRVREPQGLYPPEGLLERTGSRNGQSQPPLSVSTDHVYVIYVLCVVTCVFSCIRIRQLT